MGFIDLVTSVPGAKSKELNERRAKAVSGGLAMANGIAVVSAEGSLVKDADGNTFIDLAGGIGVLAVGHRPKSVTDAVHAQVDKYLHMCSIVANYEPYVEVCEALNRLTPGDYPKKTLLSNGGAEAVENAVKMARKFTGRAGVIVFEGAYHGRSNLTMAMTSKWGLFKKGFGPFAPEVYRLPLPNLYRTPKGISSEDYLAWCCKNLDDAMVSHIDPSAVACIVIEPVVGEGGFIPVPKAFLEKIREVCTRIGAVMIADEIQSGSGRTGKLWAIEHSNVIPDMIISAKSLAAGLPLSAITARAEIMDSAHIGGVGSTYGGNPLACVAALEALELLQSADLQTGAKTIEKTVRQMFEPMMLELPCVGDVRGIGGMMVVEFVKDQVTKEPWLELVPEVAKRCLEGGVVLLRAGLYSNCIRFLPQLDIDSAMLHEALTVVQGAIRAAYAAHKAKEPVNA
jgi:4-aminobutyrate aminotransferase / (S)-3-amino-2-methylpropionate transaminase / 5-aminovalerate transaminase